LPCAASRAQELASDVSGSKLLASGADMAREMFVEPWKEMGAVRWHICAEGFCACVSLGAPCGKAGLRCRACALRGASRVASARRNPLKRVCRGLAQRARS